MKEEHGTANTLHNTEISPFFGLDSCYRYLSCNTSLNLHDPPGNIVLSPTIEICWFFPVNPEGEAGIHAAVKNADIDMMLLLLEYGANIDRRDNLGNPWIIIQ